jgi:hypothetical protein
MSDARPSWSLAEIGGLLGWAESGALTSEELGRAGAQAPLAPSPAHWRHAADRLLAFAGILLLATGLVFFFAYNWDDLHRYAKLGLAWSAMAACGVAALFVQPGSIAYRAALLGVAAVATGVLLALIGQTYQTGADLWELFAAWLAADDAVRAAGAFIGHLAALGAARQSGVGPLSIDIELVHLASAC